MKELGALHVSRTSLSPGCAARLEGAAGAARKVTTSRCDGGLERPMASSAVTT